jgi:hypothetical protein
MDIIRESLTFNKPSDKALADSHEEKNKKLNRITEMKEQLIRLNEPTITDLDPDSVLSGILDEIMELECTDISGNRLDILTDLDKINLKIKRGSLNDQERIEIESHVIETYKFVSKIPWPPEYKNIPEIALRHHEKLDGTGYPDRLNGREATSLQSRMMAIADIYDALTAQDRPYKKSVPLDKVLMILKEEAERTSLIRTSLIFLLTGKSMKGYLLLYRQPD